MVSVSSSGTDRETLFEAIRTGGDPRGRGLGNQDQEQIVEDLQFGTFKSHGVEIAEQRIKATTHMSNGWWWANICRLGAFEAAP